MTPDGGVYCSILDWAKFITDQLRGAEGKKGLLTPALYKKIQTPPYDGTDMLGYKGAFGWRVKDNVLNHTGSDSTNFAEVYIFPKEGYAVLFCTNIEADPFNIPKDFNDIPLVKAKKSVFKELSQYYTSTYKKNK